MHETTIINFVLENFNYICIPLGFLARYIFKLLMGQPGEHMSDASPQTEIFVEKIYEYMKELRSGRDDAIEERAQLLVRNKVLREKIRELHKSITELNDQLKVQQEIEDKLRARYDDLDTRYDKLRIQHETSVALKNTEPKV